MALLAGSPWTTVGWTIIYFADGNLLQCFYEEDGEMYTAVVEETHDEQVLVTWVDDDTSDWLSMDDCSLEAPPALWAAGSFWYSIWQDAESSEFHYALQTLSTEFPSAAPALFTYFGGKEEIEGEIVDTAIHPWLKRFVQEQHPSLPIYRALPTDITDSVDNKFLLYKSYQKHPVAASVFPQTYATFADALAATTDDNELFFIKDSKGTQGQGIYILSRSDLVNQPEPDLGSVVIQRAVDVLTLDDQAGEGGLLHRRRFDIRFFVLVNRGKVYLHSNMYAMWAKVGKLYDRNDPSTENQVPKVSQYVPGKERQAIRDFLFFPNDEPWQEADQCHMSSERNLSSLLDPLLWREKIASSLDKAKSTLAELIEATQSDPLSYHLLGADAILDRSGRAILVEFNDWPDLAFFNVGRENCLKRGQCARRIVMPRESEPNGYVVTTTLTDFYSVTSGYTAQMLRDMASLVMGLETPEQLVRFREIVQTEETW